MATMENPRKKDETGIEHFERGAEVQETTSSDTEHSSYVRHEGEGEGEGRDGHSLEQTRGTP